MKKNKIEKERKKLNDLVSEAIEYNARLTGKSILKQSKRTDKLIIEYMLSKTC